MLRIKMIKKFLWPLVPSYCIQIKHNTLYYCLPRERDLLSTVFKVNSKLQFVESIYQFCFMKYHAIVIALPRTQTTDS